MTIYSTAPPNQSTGNTSTTPLSGGATFTGTADLTGLSSVMVSCQTDAAGTLYFDFSVDGTNWSVFPVAGFDVSAGVHEFHTALKGGRHFRVRLVNGAAAQTYLRLYTYYGEFPKIPNAPLNQSIGGDTDAVVVRPSSDFLNDVSLGLVSGYSAMPVFGRNPDIDTGSTPEDIWNGGGLYTGQPTTGADTLDVSSNSAADTAAGTGARTALLTGLDASGAPQTETISFNGTTAVTTSSSWLRMADLDVLTAGTGGENAGVITVKATATPADVFAVIPIGANHTLIAARTVPAGTGALLFAAGVNMARSSGAAGSANVTLRVRPDGGVFTTYRSWEITNGSPAALGALPEVLEPLTDVKICVAEVSDNNTIVTCWFDMILYPA